MGWHLHFMGNIWHSWWFVKTENLDVRITWDTCSMIIQVLRSRNNTILRFQFTNGIFKVLFEANRGTTYFGDISIDDVSFACDLTPLCNDQQYACNIAQCIPKYRYSFTPDATFCFTADWSQNIGSIQSRLYGPHNMSTLLLIVIPATRAPIVTQSPPDNVTFTRTVETRQMSGCVELVTLSRITCVAGSRTKLMTSIGQDTRVQLLLALQVGLAVIHFELGYMLAKFWHVIGAYGKYLM